MSEEEERRRQEMDAQNSGPVIKFRDDEGNLLVLESLGRDWLPYISLCRLSIRDFPAFCPPSFCVVRRDDSDACQFTVIQEDGKCVVPRCLSLLAKNRHCATCRVSGELLLCCVCRRAFHRECHLPVISSTTTDQWQCLLCRDFSLTRDRDAAPEPSASPCLSLYEQRKCEYLLLSLTCHEHGSELYVFAAPSSSRSVNMIRVRERLMGKIKPPYHTPAEVVSDLWHFLDSCSKRAPHAKELRRFFSRQLHSVFWADLHPSLLTDPYGGERELGATPV